MIALHVLYAKKEKIYPTYTSKYKSNCEKQVIILMISNGEKKMALSCSQKTISIIQRNYIKK